MPKAENRKKPPNLMGQVPGRGSHSKNDSTLRNTERENVKSKKQDIIEKMKSIQKQRTEGHKEQE